MSPHLRIRLHLLETCSLQPLSPELSIPPQSPLRLCNMLSEGSGGDAIGVSEDAGFTLRKTNPKPLAVVFAVYILGLLSNCSSSYSLLPLVTTLCVA